MPVTKSSATAFVNVRGLGIVCFNPNKKRSETAIIRSGNHKLSINVLKPAFIDGTGKDTVGFVPILSRQIDDLTDVSIEISGVGNPKTEDYEFFQEGDFDRLNGDNDENDIRWILNLEGEEMHNANLVKNEQNSLAEKPPVSKLFISNGLFYAVMPDEKELEKTPFFHKKDPSENAEQEFGYIAETMGANIEADEVLLKIKIGENEESLSLKRIEDCPYKIEISNINSDTDAMLSDLPICYEFLTDEEGVLFELNPKTENSDSGSPIFGKVYCHITLVNQDSIENFV